ncbi:MAG TPA: hypothetical protein VE685_26245 [Thermoanaerobaculia bacterium]|nr:hypothetical protein [Thermoanaerobaculia bacterium]
MKRNTLSAALLLSLTLPFAGCADAPSADSVRWEIQQRIPEARFETEEHIRLGRLTLGLIKGLLRLVPNADEGAAVVREIHRLEVATWRVHGLSDLDRLPSQTRFEDQLSRSGWAMTVKAKDGESRSWLFTRSNGEGSIRNLLVVDLNGDELSVVRLDGRLDRAFAEAIAERPREAARIASGE